MFSQCTGIRTSLAPSEQLCLQSVAPNGKPRKRASKSNPTGVSVSEKHQESVGSLRTNDASHFCVPASLVLGNTCDFNTLLCAARCYLLITKSLVAMASLTSHTDDTTVFHICLSHWMRCAFRL